jgi:hypothetical protein
MKLDDFYQVNQQSGIQIGYNKKKEYEKVIEMKFSDGEFRSFDGKNNDEILYELLSIMKEKEFINDVTVTELKLYEVYTRAGYLERVYATSIDEAIENSSYSACRIIEVKEVED